MTRAIVLSALSSGAGKTVLTLGLLGALAARGLRVASAKSGPDYIDPQFHALATGRPAWTLDAFAMALGVLRAEARAAAEGADILVVEGAMGLFDGADDGGPFGAGATADVAAALGAPVLLALDLRGASQSVAAAALGAARLRPDVSIAGVLLNRAASPRHAAMAERALTAVGAPVIAAMASQPGLETPSRHLGLVQPEETGAAAALATRAAALFDDAAIEAILAAARPLPPAAAETARLAPLGSRIAVARDVAFRFAYPHLLAGWRRAGAELTFFSPLADDAPPGDADAVYLPGGYPELHAGALASADRFKAGMRAAAARGARIYGECGGYMVLGEGLVDAGGARHAMLGLLPLESSFAAPKRRLGYRRVTARAPDWFGAARAAGHEFHYAAACASGSAEPLFDARDAAGRDLGPAGLRVGAVGGSFIHVIAAEAG